MITCKTCHQGFPRPKRRGRPPVVCDPCKAGTSTSAQKAPESAQEPVVVSTPTEAPKAPTLSLRASKRAPYRSGFCGVTRQVDGSHVTHPQHIHKLCSGHSCACDCHQGLDLWVS